MNTKTQALNARISAIAAGAKGTDAEKVRYVHEQITKSISYRYETQCTAEDAGYIRTAYALVTHKGVCEAYARSMQLVLNRLGIPCVLIHGLQASGTAEAHMWNAVLIGDEWYAVDATWDDPVGLDAGGNIKTAGKDGLDGAEMETYLLVGQDVVGADWRPSGYVSTGPMEFKYPDIALVSYGAGVVRSNGLTVTNTDGTLEGVESTVYRISFNGDGLVEAAKKGFYFLVKMYDVKADGSVTMFDNWYYPVHHLIALDGFNSDFHNSSRYFFDSPGYLTENVSNAEYVEFAVTTKAPPSWRTANDLITMGGYYSGDGSDIVAQTGMIYNPRGGNEAPPYVKNVSPLFNTPVYVGQTYTIHIEFTDPLYHPSQESVSKAPEGKVNDAEAAMKQSVTLDYTGTTYSWGVNARQPHTFANKPVPQNVRWTCGEHGTHTGIANANGAITMADIDDTCRLTQVEFEFAASRMWADDSVEYEFQLTGLVGVSSNRYLMNSGGWSYVFENQSAYCAYRCSQGIDWNLWGQPQLLDNPSDLDLSKLTVEGVDGRQESLAELASRMHLDEYDMNGRLMLVVENLDNSRSSAEELSHALSKASNVDIPAGAVRGSSLYEIDFARICGKTIVKTGDSLRMSVGFPEGITSAQGLVFKAYHFTRNSAGDIISVEEIPLTVTAYGLVIMCDSFSPFEIVALDANMIDEKPGAEKIVMILAGEGGSILLPSGASAVGKNGVVTLAEGQHVTLQVRPDSGQAVGAVTFDGHPIPVSDDGTVVIAYEDIQSQACLLSASFISAAVRQADETAGMVPVEPDAAKAASSGVSQRLEQAPGTAPEGSAEAGGSAIPPSGIAYASTQMVEIDGKKVEFQMYALKDANGYYTNYIKVRDLAYALNGTKAQFNVAWTGAANLLTGVPYIRNGTENYTPFKGNRPYTAPKIPTYINGAATDLPAILLKDDHGGGFTYCQVRDLARKLNFYVDWTYGRGIFLETDKPYSGK